MAEMRKKPKAMRNVPELRPGAQEEFDRLVEQFRPHLKEDHEKTATVVLAWLETLMQSSTGHCLDVSTLYDSMLPTMVATSIFDDCAHHVGIDPLRARQALNRFRATLKHPRSRLPRAAIRFLACYGIHQAGSRKDRRADRLYRTRAVTRQDAFLADRFGGGYLAHARAGARTYVLRMDGEELAVELETRIATRGGRKTSRLAVLSKGLLMLLSGYEQKLAAFKEFLDAGRTYNTLIYPTSLVR